MSRFSLFRWGKSKSDSEGTSRASGADRFVADDIDRKKNSNQKNSADDPQLPQKKRARRRLVGSITLVVAAIIVLPMIFESEPKPVSPNLLIDIPSRDSKPVQVAAVEQTPPTAPATEMPVTPPADQAQQVQQPQQAQTATASTEGVTPAAHPPVPAVQQVAPVQNATEQHLAAPKAKATTANDAENQKKQSEAQLKAEKAKQEKLKAEKAKADKLKAEKAKAASSDPIGQMIADKNTKTSSTGKQVIQVAALTSQQKVTELQAKLSKAGIRSHTQKVKAKNGEERIRVRVGPLSKGDADKTCSKLKSMGLSCTLVPN